MTVTMSTVDICQFLPIGGLWALASGLGLEPKDFPARLCLSSQLEGKDKDPLSGKRGGSANVQTV